jgi:hypothetical protein
MKDKQQLEIVNFKITDTQIIGTAIISFKAIVDAKDKKRLI